MTPASEVRMRAMNAKPLPVHSQYRYAATPTSSSSAGPSTLASRGLDISGKFDQQDRAAAVAFVSQRTPPKDAEENFMSWKMFASEVNQSHT